MIRAALLTALLALTAQAQPASQRPLPVPIPKPGDYAPEPPKPSATPPEAAATKPEPADQPVADNEAGGSDEATQTVRATACARGFFESLLAGDSHGVLVRTALPFQLDAQRINDPDALKKLFDDALREKRTDLLTLYGIELVTPEEMEKRYGKPPARLAALPWRRSGTKIALANLSGHGAVAILHQVQGKWRVIAYTD